MKWLTSVCLKEKKNEKKEEMLFQKVKQILPKEKQHQIKTFFYSKRVLILLVLIILSIMIHSKIEIVPNCQYFGHPLSLFSFIRFFCNPFRVFQSYVLDFAFLPPPPEKVIKALVIRFC